MQTNKRTDPQVEASVLAAVRNGSDNTQAANDHGISEATVRRIRARALQSDSSQQVVFLDKKVSEFHWRDSIPVIKSLQKLRRDASATQQFATIKVGDGSSPIAILFLGDAHIGAMGTDYDLFVTLTDIILTTPNLYFALMGDEVEWAIRLRSVAEVCAQVIGPDLQAKFIESWLNEVMHKMIFATWSNHSTDRSEQMIGTCPIKNILADKVPFFSGIGHAEIVVGNETYLLAASHRFKGVTATDSTAGCKRYLRVEWSKGEIAVQADCHRSGISEYNEGDRHLLAMSTGTLNVASSYAARNFSIYTSSAFPILVLHPNEHLTIPYWNIDSYMKGSKAANV